ncbi:hypothetical protein MVEN_01961600 [Mycena venus]|uniref:Uncharacterized protein n=1 Tax=Mycena venus TaxID=2733690 RepID=A0A8H6XH48_9AGAR|nr:hypothetical protein MVEN_01961600 [Mycena venus]
MCTPCCLLDPGTDAFQFRTIHSGRTFSEWEAISTRTFSIATAISESIELNAGLTEDLAELNSGPPVNAIAVAESTSSIAWVPSSQRPHVSSRKARDKMSSLAAPTTPATSPKPALNQDLMKTHPILDGAGKVIAVVAGMPDNPNFMQDVHDPAVVAMEKARRDASLSKDQLDVEPGQLVNGAINAAILLSFLSNSAFICLAGFTTGVFVNWAPNLFDFYVDYMGAFYKKYTHLQRPFLNGIFSTCTFNLGPWTCALGHRDFLNLAIRWCAITAFRKFDYKKGGHLILWDCKLIIEFPPGYTILIPSATIYHSNIPISDRETRHSFTQYMVGGLFRWVEHRFMNEEDYWATLDEVGQKEEKAAGLERTEVGASLFSTLEELKAMKNCDEVNEKLRMRMCHLQAEREKDPEAAAEHKEQAKEARAKYEASHGKFRAWKHKVIRADRRSCRSNEEPKDYEYEWELYKAKKKRAMQEQERQEQLAEELYVPSSDERYIRRRDGSFGYIYL